MDPRRRRRRARSASPSMPRSSWATWCSSTCPQAGRKVAKGEASPWSNRSRPRRDIYAPASGEVRRSQCRARRRAGRRQCRADGQGLVLQAEALGQGRARRPDGRGGLQRLREEPGLNTMRYLPLTDADRRDMLAVIGASSVDELFRDVPASARLGRQDRGPARSPGRARGRARLPGLCGEERRRRPRRRSSSAPAPTATTCPRPSTT